MKTEKTKRMVGVALLSAIVVVLQLIGQYIRFGPVSVSLVLIPIVVGAAVYGPGAGGILGTVFAVMVLADPTTVPFYEITVLGTVIVVLIKGAAAGYFAGLVYRALEKKNELLAVFTAAVVCPVVNTGIFCIGCRLFYWDLLAEMGGGNALLALITIMVGINFLVEFAVNIICGPVIVRIMHAVKRS